MADSRVLLMSAYRQEDGWIWGIPEGQSVQNRYISSVVAVTKRLETVRLEPGEVDNLKLEPFLRDELALDDGLTIMLGDDEFKHRLKSKYQDVLSQSPEHIRPDIHRMIELVDSDQKITELIYSAAKFSQQPEISFGHCDVRSDNIAYNDRTGEIKLVDWNWASYTPKKTGATEFMTDMARRGIDVSSWLDEVDRGMLAAVVGFYAKRCLKDPLFAGSSLREMQAESAAVAFRLYEDFSRSETAPREASI